MTSELSESEPLRIKLSRTWTVGPEHLYNPAGPDADRRHQVLSSPSMIWEMETTCAELAKQALRGEGQTTVGFHVDVKHVSPAKPGASIVTKAVLEAKDGKKLTFSVEAREGDRLVGVGKHRRAIVALSELG